MPRPTSTPIPLPSPEIDALSGDRVTDLAIPAGPDPEDRGTSPKGTWALQRSQRSTGWYYQAVFGSGKDRVAVALGTLDEDRAAEALANLRVHGGRLLTVRPDGRRVMDNAAIKALALGAPLAVGDLDAVLAEVGARKLIEASDYGSMTLREFVEHVWRPVRMRTNAPSTWKTEWSGAWRAGILPVLGHLKLKQLDAHKWQMFLSTRDGKWSGRMQAWAQNAYRCALRYARKIGAIEREHEFEKIKGASKRTLQAGEALTPDEVRRLIEAANPCHRALFAYAFGQGLRPKEAVSLDWSHVFWDRGAVYVAGSKNAQAAATVCLTPAALPELKAWWEACGCPRSGPAFTWRGKPIRSWRQAFESTVERAGLNPDGKRRLIPYSARYTFATLAVVSGIHDAAVRKAMRHTYASRVLETVYQRLSEDQTREALSVFPTFGTPAQTTPAPSNVVALPKAKGKARKAS